MGELILELQPDFVLFQQLPALCELCASVFQKSWTHAEGEMRARRASFDVAIFRIEFTPRIGIPLLKVWSLDNLLIWELTRGRLPSGPA